MAKTGGATSSTIEIHGYVNCVFAWRVRLAAAEKGLPFDWIPCDVPAPEPRAAAHNPHEHSPLLHHGGLSLLESEIITAYLDETFPSRPLLPRDPGERALLRMFAARLKAVDVHMEPSRPEALRRLRPALELLELALAAGALGVGRRLPPVGGHEPASREGEASPRAFLHGDEPGFADLMLWPFLFHSVGRGLIEPAAFPALAASLSRAASRPSYASTRPPWAPSP